MFHSFIVLAVKPQPVRHDSSCSTDMCEGFDNDHKLRSLAADARLHSRPATLTPTYIFISTISEENAWRYIYGNPRCCRELLRCDSDLVGNQTFSQTRIGYDTNSDWVKMEEKSFRSLSWNLQRDLSQRKRCERLWSGAVASRRITSLNQEETTLISLEFSWTWHRLEWMNGPIRKMGEKHSIIQSLRVLVGARLTVLSLNPQDSSRQKLFVMFSFFVFLCLLRHFSRH